MTNTGCPATVPDGQAVASAVIAAPQDWQLLGYGVAKLALAAATDLNQPGKDAVLLVRRQPIAGGEREGRVAQTTWAQMDRWLTKVDPLLPAGSVPAQSLVPSSAALTASLESIIDRSSPANKPYAGPRVPWNRECGDSAVWASIDVHHRSAGAYAIELKPYSSWSLDLRRSRNPVFRQTGQPGTMPAPMPTKDARASLRAGHLVSLRSQAIYEFTTDQMRDWLMSGQEEPPSLLQRRA